MICILCNSDIETLEEHSIEECAEEIEELEQVLLTEYC